MRSTQRRFGQLRALLHDSPPDLLWPKLVRLLDGWPEPDFMQVALPYVTQSSRWEEMTCRPAPRRWVLGALAGERVPELVLANEMILQAPEVEEARGWRRAKAWIRQMKGVEIWGEPRLAHDVSQFLDWCDFSVFDQLHTLSFSFCTLGAEGIEHLVSQSAGLDDLRALHFDQADVGAQGLKVLGASSMLEQLERFDLQWEREGRIEEMPQALASFLTSPKLRHLRHLGLEGNDMSDLELGDVFNKMENAVLETLILSFNDYRNLFSDVLMAPAFCNSLKRLHVGGNRLSGDQAEMVNSLLFSSLHAFYASSHPLTGRAFIRALAQNKNLGEMEELDLSYTDLSGSDFNIIPNRGGFFALPHFQHLRVLELDGCDDIASLLNALKGAETMKLKRLSLDDTAWTPEQCEALAKLPALQEVEVLHLGRCNLTDEHLQALFPPGAWSKLRTLRLGPNPITEASYQWFAKHVTLPHLINLEIGSMTEDLDVEPLSQWPMIEQLHSLGLWGVLNDLQSVESVLDLCSDQLEELAIHHSVLRADVLSAIFTEEFPFLHTLYLPFDVEEEEVMDDMIHARFMRHLHTLTLEHGKGGSWLTDSLRKYDERELPLVLLRHGLFADEI